MQSRSARAAVTNRAETWSLSYSLLFFAAIAVLVLSVVTKLVESLNLGVNIHSAQSAAVSFCIISLSAALLYLVKLRFGFSSAWFWYALTFNSLIVIIKLIISPAAFSSSVGQVTYGYVFAGLAVMALYLVGLWAIYVIYKKHTGLAIRRGKKYHRISWAIKLPLVASLFALALLSRLIMAGIFSDTATADYLKTVFSSNGLVLPLILALMIMAAIESFELAAVAAAAKRNIHIFKNFFFVSAGMIITYHLLWLIYTALLFKWM